TTENADPINTFGSLDIVASADSSAQVATDAIPESKALASARD
ncbi:hypothetical protein V493_07897, partial [Pseudogymnoascus sp. VKM F-4281 (FW-2241)]